MIVNHISFNEGNKVFFQKVKNRLSCVFIANKYLQSSPINYKNLFDINNQILLDTSLESSNYGDDIIMFFANRQLSSIFSRKKFDRIKTHGNFIKNVDDNYAGRLKIVCGTTALSTDFSKHIGIALPLDVSLYSNSVLLLATGLGVIGNNSSFNLNTKKILRNLLISDDKSLHSVRGSRTEISLKEAGIDNVLNTACVTR